MTPKYIFIVPYRDRQAHRLFFLKYIDYILEDYSKESYEILFSHQNNTLSFNRGAVKNIGFHYIREKYPDAYKKMVFIFQDVDTMPHRKNLLNYDVSGGEIKHFYGYTYTLGGIFSINGEDFEKINGFPNYWEWGFEDNVLNKRAIQHNIHINRSTFFPIDSMEILHFYDEINKKIDKRVLNNTFNKSFIEKDGLNSLNHINYQFNHDKNMLDIHSFQSSYSPQNMNVYIHNLKNGPTIRKKKRNPTMTMKFM